MKLNLDNLPDGLQERMCDLCERNIICGKSMTSTFLCEGAYCEQAVELLEEELTEEEIAKREEYFDKFKYLLIIV